MGNIKKSKKEKTNIEFNFNSQIIDLIFLSFVQSDDIICVFKIVNSKEELYYANPSFYKNLSYTKTESKDIKFSDLFGKVSKKEKIETIEKLREERYLIRSTSLIGKDYSFIPVTARLYLFESANEFYLIIIAKSKIEKNILEYRKYISEFLLKNFQNYGLDEKIIEKVAESIFIFFEANTLFYLPMNAAEDAQQLFYMKDSALTKISKEEVIQPIKEIIENNLYLIKIKKEPVVIKMDKKKIKNTNIKTNQSRLGAIFFNNVINTGIIIPIYIENDLQAIIFIGTERDEFFLEEINLIRFTFQGILIFKMKEFYLKELYYQKSCFSDLLNHSLEMHYRQNIQTRKLEYISKACFNITGFTDKELMEEPSLFWERIYHEDKKKLLEKYQTRFNKSYNSENYYEYRFKHKDGSLRWLSDLFTIIFDNDGKALYIVGSLRDITKQKENEIKMIEMEKQIAQSQKMEALGRFSSEISHDFNNILIGIKGNIQLSFENLNNLKDKFTDTLKNINVNEIDLLNDEVVEIENNLKDNLEIIKKGLQLTERIKLFSQKKQTKSALFEINEAIYDIKTIFKYSKEKDITIIFDLTKEKVFINMNRTQFDQVILNLLVNAFDSIEKSGKITITTEIIKKEDLNLKKAIKLDPKEDYIKITISDTGHGIDKKNIPKIFEPFFTTKEEKGTGLGLSIVYSIIKQNGGQIELTSKVGVGTSFYLYLPIEKTFNQYEKN